MALSQRSVHQQARFNFPKTSLRSSFGESNARIGSVASPLTTSNALYERGDEKFSAPVSSVYPEKPSALSSLTSFNDTISRAANASATSSSSTQKVHNVLNVPFESSSKAAAPLQESLSHGHLNIGSNALYTSSPGSLEMEQRHSHYSISSHAAAEKSNRPHAAFHSIEMHASAPNDISFSNTSGQQTMRNSSTNPPSFSPYRNVAEEIISVPYGDNFTPFQKNEMAREVSNGRTAPSQSVAFNPESIAYCFLEEYYSRFNSGPAALVELYYDSASLLWVLPISYNLTESLTTRESPLCTPSVKMAEGKEAIMTLLSTLFIGGSKTEVQWVHVLRSLPNSLLVSVKGRMWMRGEMVRDFVQSFVLAALSPMWYFVLSDILRFFDLNVVPTAIAGTPAPISSTLPMFSQSFAAAHSAVGVMEAKGAESFPYAASPIPPVSEISLTSPAYDHPFQNLAMSSIDNSGTSTLVTHSFSKDLASQSAVLPSAVPYSEEARADGARILQLLQNYRQPTVQSDLENQVSGVAPTTSSQPPLETTSVGRGSSLGILSFNSTSVKSPATIPLKPHAQPISDASDFPPVTGLRRAGHGRRDAKSSLNESFVAVQHKSVMERRKSETAVSTTEPDEQKKVVYADIVMKHPKMVVQKNKTSVSQTAASGIAPPVDAVKHIKSSQSKTLFVVNLPSSLNEGRIREVIKEQLETETNGYVVSIQHSKNQNKQFGFIQMDSEASVGILLKKPLVIDGIRLLIERSTSKPRVSGDAQQKYGTTTSRNSASGWKTTKQNAAVKETARHVEDTLEQAYPVTETENQQNNISPTQKRNFMLSSRRGARLHTRENTSKGNKVTRSSEFKV